MSVARKVAYNTAVQILGRVLGLFIALITINYIATNLAIDGSTLTGFGQYTIVFTFVSIIGTAADLGLFTLLVRELVGKSQEEVGKIIGSALWFRGLLLLAGIVITLLLVSFLPYDPVVKQGIMIGVVIAFSMLFSQVIASVFQAQLLTHKIVIAETLGKLFIMVATIYVLSRGMGLLPVVWVNLLGQLVTLLISYLMARPTVKFVIKPNWEMWRELFPEFFPIAIISVMGLAHFKIDTLLLSVLKSAEDVGIYGLAYKLVEVVLIIPSILATNLLPVMTGFAYGDTDYLVQIIRRTGLILLLIAVPITVFSLIFAQPLIVFIAHSGFNASVLPFRILAIAIMVIFLTTLISQAVISAKRQKVLIPAYALALAANIGLNLYAIPRYSYLGAAVTTLVTEVLLLVFMMASARKVFQASFSWPFLGRILIAGLISFGLLLTGTGLIENLFPEGQIMQGLYLLVGAIAVFVFFAGSMLVCCGGSLRRVVAEIRGDS